MPQGARNLKIVGQASLPVAAARASWLAPHLRAVTVQAMPTSSAHQRPAFPWAAVARAKKARASSTGRDACPTDSDTPRPRCRFPAARTSKPTGPQAGGLARRNRKAGAGRRHRRRPAPALRSPLRIDPQPTHIRAADSGPRVGLLAIGRRRAAHVAFHLGQPGASRTRRDVGASRAHRQVARADGAHLGELRRMVPDIDKALLADVTAGQRELHAGVEVSVGRYVAGAMAGAARHGRRGRRR